jgi:hypothetical protein
MQKNQKAKIKIELPNEGQKEFELDFLESYILACLTEQNKGMKEGISYGFFNDGTLRSIGRKFAELGIITEYAGRYYLIPQMYAVMELIEGNFDFEGIFLNNFPTDFMDGRVDFRDFMLSKYFNAIFQDKFSREFSEKTESLLSESGAASPEYMRHTAEQTKTNDKFTGIVQTEIRNWQNQISVSVINA